MNHYAKRISIACLLLAFCNATSVLSQPQPVPKLTERQLDKASYVELAKEWKEYIEKNGESVEALVNLAMAYDYSGEVEAARIAGRRAVEIGPDNPKALAFLGKMLCKNKGDLENALKLLERCREVAPDHEDGLTTLAAIYLKRGELAKSEEVFRTIFDQRIISRPLQDYAYNMLVGLPHSAVLVTNGDNDTFPPLALQAGMDFREDVIVINRSLLNLKAYAEAIFKRYPSIKPKGKIKPEKGRSLSSTLLQRMVDEHKVPVYFASSVCFEDLGFSPELTTEGLNKRSSEKGLTAEESGRLFLETYRLDSATDWNFAWSLVPSVSTLLGNYVWCIIKLAEQDQVSVDTKRRLLGKALGIATFHDMTRASQKIKSLEDE